MSAPYIQALEEELARDSISAVAVLELLLREAHSFGASDIHLNPSAEEIVVRFRIDGILYDAHSLPISIQSELLARLKILADLRTDEHHLPQDGRFRFFIEAGISFDVRVSITSTYHGGNAVLRLLASSGKLSELASLGITAEQEILLQAAIARPHGMILITGPTGSGKTSTLYALLQLLNTRSISIVTIEDPIEFALPGINQVPVDQANGFTFADGLRSILRQDPDVIGIGEIRDAETAALATNAALTGHLVLSTLHTTDAPSALTRLMDMGIEPYLISSTVNLIVGQRLVRRLCPNCIQELPLRKDQETLLSLIPKADSQKARSYKSNGCSACRAMGSIGRTGIFELLPMNTALRNATLQKVPGHTLYELAIDQGMVPLLADGAHKTFDGQVSLDEIISLMAQ